MSWYRTYRPTTIAGLHLSQVRDSFLQLMAQGHLPQVMLFAGPKGTGKTSTSRIIAAMVNDPSNEAQIKRVFFKSQQTSSNKSAKLQEPGSEITARVQTGSSLMVHELDAASNRGIDDVRALKERLNLPPQDGLMSVYILDEVHMLTTEAFNALLKVLEEPPPHVIFILATTELHKVPATVVSRCTVIRFTKATVDELMSVFKQILDQEKIKYDQAALELLAQRADGSFRDGVKMLELVAQQHGKVTTQAVETSIVSNVQEHVQNLITAITTKDEKQVAEIFKTLRDIQVEAAYFEKSLFDFLHHTLLQNLGVLAGEPFVNERVAHYLLTELSKAQTLAAPIPLLPLELKALEIVFKAHEKNTKPGSSGNSGLKNGDSSQGKSSSSSTSSLKVAPVTDSVVSSQPTASELRDIDEATSTYLSGYMEVATTPPFIDQVSSLRSDNLVVPSPGDSAKLLEKWQEFVEGVKTKNSSVAAILGSAKPQVGDNGKAIITVYYRFHKEQLQQPKFLRMLHESVQSVIGEQVDFEVVVASPPDLTKDGKSTELAALAADVLM